MTELEVVKGILEASNSGDHTLAFIRSIKNVRFELVRQASRFIDMTVHKIDSEAQEFLSTLRDQKLVDTLPPENLCKYDVEWNESSGIQLDEKTEYIAEFCSDFEKKIVELVERAVTSQRDLSHEAAYRETLQHLHACRNFCQIFQGREEVVHRVKEYVLGASTLPLVLHGESGCGKTSLLAKSASLVSTVQGFPWVFK